jgi:hypothetical protein
VPPPCAANNVAAMAPCRALSKRVSRGGVVGAAAVAEGRPRHEYSGLLPELTCNAAKASRSGYDDCEPPRDNATGPG